MDRRKKADWRRYLLVLLITALLFGAGVVLGINLGNRKIENLRALQESLLTDTLDIETQFSIVEREPCTFVNTSTLADQLYEVGRKLDYLEGMIGKEDEYVLRLKKYYMLLEVRQWLFERKVQEQCHIPKDLILYFYSNDEEKCPQCQEQGFILTYLRRKYPDSVSVYSFDVESDSVALTALKRRYSVESTPSIVVDDRMLQGFRTTDEVEGMLASIETTTDEMTDE